MCSYVLPAVLMLASHRHLNAELVACGIDLVQLRQQRVLQRLQDCDFCGDALRAATGQHEAHISKHSHEAQGSGLGVEGSRLRLRLCDWAAISKQQQRLQRCQVSARPAGQHKHWPYCCC